MPRKGGILSEEQKQKLKEARDAYWVKEKERRKKFAQEHPNIALERSKKRRGAGGRPPTVNTPDTARENVVAEINQNRKDILKAQIEAAKGLYYLNSDGKTIYTKPPNIPAGEYLLNQLIGKPKESLEIKSTNLNVDI